MRFLIVGAGALGGYFGARMLEAGLDVTFLVRPRRAAQLAKTGLVVRSPFGDVSLPTPPRVLADQIAGPYDVVVLGCKAYDLDSTIAAVGPAVGEGTTVLPLLNGLDHVDRLQARFGAARVIGGQCVISATLDGEGRIVHVNRLHGLSYGELSGTASERIQAIEQTWKDVRFKAKACTDILYRMWEKWCFIAALAGVNCLMRAPIGEIVAAGGAELAVALYEECAAVGAAMGFAPRAEARELAVPSLVAAGSTLAASMLKDLERGSRTEAEHILGRLLAHGQARSLALPLLRAATLHLRVYEERLARA